MRPAPVELLLHLLPDERRVVAVALRPLIDIQGAADELKVFIRPIPICGNRLWVDRHVGVDNHPLVENRLVLLHRVVEKEQERRHQRGERRLKRADLAGLERLLYQELRFTLMLQRQPCHVGDSSFAPLSSAGRVDLPHHFVDPKRVARTDPHAFHADGEDSDTVGKQVQLEGGDVYRCRASTAVFGVERQPGIRRNADFIFAEQAFLFAGNPPHGSGVEIDAPDERVEEHHILISARVGIETLVRCPFPGAEAPRDFIRALVGFQPVVETFNPAPVLPDAAMVFQHRFPVDGEREKEVCMQVRNGWLHPLVIIDSQG